jgi:methylisocitrate lyase
MNEGESLEIDWEKGERAEGAASGVSRRISSRRDSLIVAWHEVPGKALKAVEAVVSLSGALPIENDNVNDDDSEDLREAWRRHSRYIVGTEGKITRFNPQRNLEIMSAGSNLRKAVEAETPLQMVGTINAYSALLAERAGFKAIYLSGAGVANASFGLPDLGITTLNDVCEDTRRITAACPLPLLVDADTGWGSAFNIARAIRELIRAGAAGCHLEDQEQAKRCGHRPNKSIVSTTEMVDRIRAAVDARATDHFVVMARTDAVASEGLEPGIERAGAYVEAGADMIFAEALHGLEDYRKFTSTISVPVLANLTEFGKTPLFTVEELREVGVRLVLYPLSAFRAMSESAVKVYETIRTKGTQKEAVGQMQTRAELYDVLNYHSFEDKLDQLFSKEK